MRMRRFLFVSGLFAVILLAVPGWILGENAVFTYHDQLDGEMIAYILQAKHLGQGQTLPEFMGGAAKTALTPPAPGCVLLFRLCSPLAALFIMQLAGSLTGYIGMYLLAEEVTDSAPAAFVSGVLYAALPFLPVYGLSQSGLPLLLWFVIRMHKGKLKIPALVYGVFYTVNSSLVLVGFAVLLALALWCLVRRDRWSMFGLWPAMAVTYILTNLSLIGQMLGAGGGSVSHKAEYVLAAEDFLSGWLKGFLHGGQHSVDYHIWFLGPAVLFLLVGLCPISSGLKSLQGSMLLCIGCSFCLAGVSACWNSGAGILLRSHMGALGAFQLDRLLWLCPCLWYLLSACCVAQALRLFREERRSFRALGALGCVLTAAALGLAGLQIVKNSDVKSNIQKLRNADYPAMSYSDYYAVGVLGQVREFLQVQTGLEQEDYHVVSLGIDPAAALYHGFYCLDGYSNNYSLEYKHSFRRIIAPALERSEYLRDYYDGWGNRCYIFGTESPGYYTIEKNGFYFQHLELDVDALRELGGDYLFSAAYIANSEELGLTLLREEPFETEGSYYRIYLYGVE